MGTDSIRQNKSQLDKILELQQDNNFNFSYIEGVIDKDNSLFSLRRKKPNIFSRKTDFADNHMKNRGVESLLEVKPIGVVENIKNSSSIRSPTSRYQPRGLNLIENENSLTKDGEILFGPSYVTISSTGPSAPTNHTPISSTHAPGSVTRMPVHTTHRVINHLQNRLPVEPNDNGPWVSYMKKKHHIKFKLLRLSILHYTAVM